MNILYCGDGNIADGVMISVLSLMERVKEELNIYLVTATVNQGSTCYKALSSDFAKFLNRTVKKTNADNSVYFYDITDLFSKNPPTANIETRFTPCCMLRLYADLIPGLPDKILYLDNDVICRLNPSEFYNQNINDFELVGVLDYYGSWFFKNKPLKRDYINSGVLLLNLGKIRKTGLFEKCRERCANTEMFMPDQSAINKLAEFKKICSRKFNEQRKLHSDTVFQHFTTSFRFFPWLHTVSVKPWNIEGMQKTLKLHEYDNLLNRYTELKKLYNEKEAIYDYTERNSYFLFNR